MAVTYNLAPVYQGPQFTNAGGLLVAGKIYWYLAGTSTPATVYQNATGSAAHTQPIILDSRGEAPAPIYLVGGSQYKAVLQDSSGAQLQVIDNITGVGDSSFANYSLGQVTIDSTGNGAKLFQGASGDLEILTNLSSGTSGLWKIQSGALTFPDTTTQSTGAGSLATTPEMQAGTVTNPRVMTPALVSSAIIALAPKTYYQTISSTLSTASATTVAANTWVSAGFSITITPQKIGNKINFLGLFNGILTSTNPYFYSLAIYKNGTLYISFAVPLSSTGTSASIGFQDTASSLSAITYSIYYSWAGTGSQILTLSSNNTPSYLTITETSA